MVTRLMDADAVGRALARLAHEVVEAEGGAEDLVLVGIQTRGVPLAHRLAAAVAESEGVEVPVGALDTTLYRDDVRSGRVRTLDRTDVPVPVDGRVVVLVDDVLFTGRTIRAALDAVLALGRPAAVRLVVLVDRGHRELPIRADHVGREVPTALAQRITVRVAETDDVDAVDVDEDRGRGVGDAPDRGVGTPAGGGGDAA